MRLRHPARTIPVSKVSGGRLHFLAGAALTRWPLRAVLAGCCALGLLLVGAFAPTAQAALDSPALRSVPLPLADDTDVTGGDIAVTADRVFVSTGVHSDAIVVTDAAGAAIDTISHLPGPSELLVSDDQRTLFAVLSRDAAVVAFDTASLAETARYDLGAGCEPLSVAQARTILWIGYKCETEFRGDIAAVDLAARPATVRRGLHSDRFGDPPALLSVPTDRPDLLVTGGGTTVTVFASDPLGSLTQVRQSDFRGAPGTLEDLATSPDGSRIYTASGAPYVIQAFAADDLTVPRQRYSTGPYPCMVDLPRDGRYVAGGTTGPNGGIYIFAPNGLTVLSEVLPGNLAGAAASWSPDATRLYALTGIYAAASTPERPTLHVLTPAGT